MKETMERSRDSGMQTFDQVLYDLSQAGRIYLEVALDYAHSRNNLTLRIRLAESRGTAVPEDSASKLSIEAETFRSSGMCLPVPRVGATFNSSARARTGWFECWA